jgi:hypothetical protein
MEQYLLQLPKKLAQEVRQFIANGEANKVEMISGGTSAILWYMNMQALLYTERATESANDWIRWTCRMQPTTSTLSSW